jgi:high-affinity iron transporter
MDWASIIPGSILGLREGLEAFLIVGIMMKYLERIGRHELKRAAKLGMALGIGGSLCVGLILWGAISLLEGSSENIGKFWESLASIGGLILLSTFIFWMMKHGKTVSSDVEKQVAARISPAGITLLASVVVLREGAEISLFAFSSVNQRPYLLGVAFGVMASAVIAFLLYLSLIRVNLSTLFTITLAYLVLQAGYLLGYSVHEFLSAMRGLGNIAEGSMIFIRAFDFADTILDHKNGALGIALNVMVGWYSRPEWIQLVLHCGYVAGMLLLWRLTFTKQNQKEELVKNSRH